MTPLQFSSGDLIADRRAEYAEGLLASGEAAAAADLYLQALEVAPGWVAGWYRLGEIRTEHGLPAAGEAFAEALRLDPADQLGAALRLDLLRGQPLVETMPSAFVETLFDQYADHFDHALVETLNYRAPQLLRAGLEGEFARVLDLGCGTGLMGAELRASARHLEGWDISAEMLREAEAKGVYDRLEKADLSVLAPVVDAYDLITAADVFAYLGALEQIVGGVALALAPGGRFAFTVEAYEGEGFVLRESRRYAHSEDYVCDLLARAGFEARIGRAVLRMDRGAPIEGLIVQAVRAAQGVRRQSDGEDLAFA
ncbi:methyltransferase domain-containing protein [Sinirhodobacter sp. HNIBRBA609]|nr:methyltransferase domain-containing protein [Sinirhodobacter sp. HNIBRBA609]